MVIAIIIAAAVVVMLVGPLLVVAYTSHERRWTPPKWWSRPVDGPGLRQSVRMIDDRAPAELVVSRDPRLLGRRSSK